MPIRNNILFVSLIIILSTFLQPSLSQQCHPQDKKALLDIKKAFGNPSDLKFWNPKTECCHNWFGVSCDETTGRVNSLLLGGDSLVGPIPPQVGDLPYLQRLDIHHSPIVGPIPPSMAKLKRLQFFHIIGCNVSGPVPEFLSQLKSLESITYISTRLAGPIPPSIGTLPNLTSLSLQLNEITGPIPETFGSFKGRNFVLHLPQNKLSGRIPASLGRKKDFHQVDLSSNNLVGDAAFLFGRDKKSLFAVGLSGNALSFDVSKVEFPEGLVQLELQRNNIFGTLTRVKFPKSIIHLDMSHNKISGAIPADLTTLINLQGFNVSYNQLCGKIPVGGEKFDATAYFHNRCLCGAPLPDCN